MYITPDQLADRPGATEIAEVATPEREAIVDADLMAATLTDGDRSQWSADQIAVADATLATVQDAIDDADSLVDGYLANRYSLPLAKVPGVLVVWTRAITRYLLHKNRKSMESDDPIVRDYRDALKALGLVAAGKLSLGADDPTIGGAALGEVKFVSDGTVFGRDQTRSFR